MTGDEDSAARTVLRRFLPRLPGAVAVTGIALVGAVVGMQLAFAAQDAASDDDRAPDDQGAQTRDQAVSQGTLAGDDGATATGPPGVPSADPAPADEPQTLLAWTRTTLDPALEPTAHAHAAVLNVSVVRGDVADLVVTRDAEGRVVQQWPDGWRVPLDAVAVDPDAHAAFAPLADRAAVAGLQDGEALLSRTSAQLRGGIGAGATLELADGTRLTVAGVVENTTIGAAELAVTTTTGAVTGIDNPRYLLVEYERDRAVVEAALRSALPPDAAVRFRAPGETPYLRQSDAVLPPLRLKELFGEFSYRPPPPGEREFEQDPAWQSEHLVQRTLPILGPVRCHRAVIEAVESALAELQAANLSALVDPAGFRGCWNPRLVQPDGDLSHHAWGVALDINYEANPTCKESIQDHRLVDILDRWGFTWGGAWLCPDPAHFEYVSPPQ